MQLRNAHEQPESDDACDDHLELVAEMLLHIGHLELLLDVPDGLVSAALGL
ncbi:hypothetical protein D3C83_258110 [compost metagenome]